MILAISLVLAGGAAWLLTGVVRGYALRRNLLDIPNHRSSHVHPTPRGGGLAIAVVTMIAVVVLMSGGMLSAPVGVALLLGGGAVAGIGWLDDHRHVPAVWRALAQSVAAIWVVYWIGVPETLRLGPWSVPLGAAAYPIAVVGLVWLTNLFNFMDGIDGIAASEAVIVAGVGGAMLLVAGAPGPGALALVMAAAAGGFLIWNWPPARVFMGDVGSGLLGFVLGTIALAGSVDGAVPIMVWAILLGVFLFDASATLLRRVVAGERFFEPHRRHAYQRAVQAGYGHGRVTLGVILLNIPLAALAGAAWLISSYAPLAAVGALFLLAACYLVVERHSPMWKDGVDRVPRPPLGTVR